MEAVYRFPAVRMNGTKISHRKISLPMGVKGAGWVNLIRHGPEFVLEDYWTEYS